MKKYQYQLVRYIHDRVTSEFVNIGIVLFMPESNFIQSKIINKFSRISHFFNEVNGSAILKTLKQIKKDIDVVSHRIESNDLFEKVNSLAEITSSILPKDDSVIEFSNVKFGIDINGSAAIDDLFERIIDKYNSENDKDIHDDKFVWKNTYKKYFDDNGITQKLKEHTVKTNNDKIHFDKAWKNGAWNCFQPLNFDLKKNDSIKNKVYKWSGIINELEKSDGNVHLFFLTEKLSKDERLKTFITETLNRKLNKVKTEIITKNEAAKFTASIKKKIEEHELEK